MIDKWTDKRRAAFVRYRNECVQREEHGRWLKVLGGCVIFLAGLVCGLMI